MPYHNIKLLLASLLLCGVIAGCKDKVVASNPVTTNSTASSTTAVVPYSGTIKDTVRDSTPDYLVEPQAPASAPNIVIVLADDVGYADTSPYGSEIHTPNLQALAEGGIRYSHFTATAMCSPTRAAVLTGMNQHSVGVGWISEWDFGYPGYRGELPINVDTLPQILQQHGYSTFAVGKWHLTNANHRSNIGPFTSWPTQKGFDRYWGFLDGEVSQWFPHALVSGNEFVDYPKDGSFYLPDALSEHAIQMLKDKQAYEPKRPFLLYYTPGNAHAPHHTKKADRDKYLGNYAAGWDAIRAQRLEQQKALGLMPQQTKLSHYNADVQAWDTLTADQQKMYARFQENYAGYVDNLDQNVGKLMQYLKDSGQWDNTIFIFLSDNGASREVSVEGDSNALRFYHRKQSTTAQNLQDFDQIGEAKTHPHYPHGWVQTSNTPFAEAKRTTNEGGVRVPMIVSWPKGITRPGVRSQFHHVNDIAPTLLEAIGLNPATAGSRAMEGTSMLYSFNDAKIPSHKKEQYYEIEGNRGYVSGDWKIVSYRGEDGNYDSVPWKLFNLADDPGETQDLSGEYPERVKELTELWQRDAERYHVLPLIDVPLMQRAMYTQIWKDNKAVENFHYVAGVSTIPRFKGPILPNRSYQIVAKIQRDNTEQAGVLVAQGDYYSGFTLYIKDNYLQFEQNIAHTVTHITSAAPLPAGDLTLEYRFDKINTGLAVASGVFSNGTGFNPLDVLQGTGSLWINGTKVGEAKLDYPVFAVWEGMDIGMDRITPVAPDYAAPFPFVGRLNSLDFNLQ